MTALTELRKWIEELPPTYVYHKRGQAWIEGFVEGFAESRKQVLSRIDALIAEQQPKPSAKWLSKMADAEDQVQSVAVNSRAEQQPTSREDGGEPQTEFDRLNAQFERMKQRDRDAITKPLDVRIEQLTQDNLRLRKTLSFVPAKIAIKAQEKAGFGVEVKLAQPAAAPPAEQGLDIARTEQQLSEYAQRYGISVEELIDRASRNFEDAPPAERKTLDDLAVEALHDAVAAGLTTAPPAESGEQSYEEAEAALSQAFADAAARNTRVAGRFVSEEVLEANEREVTTLKAEVERLTRERDGLRTYAEKLGAREGANLRSHFEGYITALNVSLQGIADALGVKDKPLMAGCVAEITRLREQGAALEELVAGRVVKIERTGRMVGSGATFKVTNASGGFAVCDTIAFGIKEVTYHMHPKQSAPAPSAEIVGRSVGEHPDWLKPSAWECKVRAAGKTDPPQDCDWPGCGCDPAANKVLAAIEEDGFKIVKPSADWEQRFDERFKAGSFITQLATADDIKAFIREVILNQKGTQ